MKIVFDRLNQHHVEKYPIYDTNSRIKLPNVDQDLLRWFDNSFLSNHLLSNCSAPACYMSIVSRRRVKRLRERRRERMQGCEAGCQINVQCLYL